MHVSIYNFNHYSLLDDGTVTPLDVVFGIEVAGSLLIMHVLSLATHTPWFNR